MANNWLASLDARGISSSVAAASTFELWALLCISLVRSLSSDGGFSSSNMLRSSLHVLERMFALVPDISISGLTTNRYNM
ncbi:Os05g0544750 [Oryza sativa Japonica Group]|uniref:Os05g0544750 protein n=1 Tax=Oryza sativa subsp. japonica TaxID=39947 RepID=A0A0P0WQE2_ORYSJ|nr:Os05g0544750 [Oryza sativa Japonica Group]